MVKAVEVTKGNDLETQEPTLDSKYRLIIVAAKRSKQIMRGATPRVEMDMHRHKPTRIALEEVQRGKVDFKIQTEK